MSFLKAFPREWLVARADQTLLTLAILSHRPGFAANQQAPHVTAAAPHHAAMTTCHKTQEVLLILSGPCITVSAKCQANNLLQSADGPDHACHRAFCVTCQSCMSSHHACVQVTPDQLMTALTTRAIETMGERIVKNLDAAAASVSRDALAKNLYAKLFDWLVAAINRKISAIGKQSHEADTKS